MQHRSMNIVMIGSGNVAAVLGRKFLHAGHRILQVCSRNESAAAELAREWNTVSTSNFNNVSKGAEVYILAVTDRALASVAATLYLPGRVVAHTAGSVDAEVLQPISEHYGTLYPLQSLRKEMDRIPEIPFFYDGNDQEALTTLRDLAASVSSHQPVHATTGERKKLHLAAVFINNFTNHLFSMAESYCRNEGIDFKLLHPLAMETVLRLENISPSTSMTGPAVRDDQETIRMHLELLNNFPLLQRVYRQLTESIRESMKQRISS